MTENQSINTFTEPPKALAEERAKTNFPVNELTYYLHHGKANAQQAEEIALAVSRDPLFKTKNVYDLSLEEQRERTFKQVARIHEYTSKYQPDDESTLRMYSTVLGLVAPAATTRIGVHTGLFLNAIRGQGTDKQYEYWVGRGAASLHRFYGSFSMTELAHGSNVAGLETTATYDERSQEFIINTPTVAATKWWIGGAAHSSNHTLCFARLIVKGKDHGVNAFVVQLRDQDSHAVLPNIAVGDIGKKMGREGIDNGWIQFSNVRIPRTNMLMRFTRVTPEGEVQSPPMAQLAYGALIAGRVNMARESYSWARRFLTIAIRYGSIRRQFSAVPNQKETKLLDYGRHQRRLMPLLAETIGIEAASSQLIALHNSVNAKLASLDVNDKAALPGALDAIKELFALSAGLKAFSTWACANIIDECRQACGGHGYSAYNGFGQGFNDWVVNCTWEGDNNVLCLSAGRALIQSGLKVLETGKASGPVDYLERHKELAGAKLAGRDLKDPAVAVEAWNAVAANAIIDASQKYKKLVAKGISKTEAFEQLSLQRFTIAQLHTQGFQVRALYDRIKEAEKSIQPVLGLLATLMHLTFVEKQAAQFLRFGYIQSSDLAKLTASITEGCKSLRELAIGITDAFGLPDEVINSPIGNYNGDVYRDYYQRVTTQQDGLGIGTKAHYYDLQKAYFDRKEEDIAPLDEE